MACRSQCWQLLCSQVCSVRYVSILDCLPLQGDLEGGKVNLVSLDTYPTSLIGTSTVNHGSGNDPYRFSTGRVPMTTHVPTENTRFRQFTYIHGPHILIPAKFRSCRMSRQRTGHLLPWRQGSHCRSWVLPHQGVFQHQSC